METPTPFDLNEAIHRWQQTLANSPAFKADNLEELASHLRASVQRLKATGLSEEEAFLIAARRVGQREPLELEFAKVNPVVAWSLPVVSFWIVAAIYLLRVTYALNMSIYVLLRMLKHIRQFTWDEGHVRQVWDFSKMSVIDFLPGSVVVEWSVGLVMVFILVARLAGGSWKSVASFIRSFEHPIRVALVLILFGCILAFLPALLICFMTRNEMGQYAYVARIAAANFVLVLAMVFLARWGLRKIPTADAAPRKNWV